MAIKIKNNEVITLADANEIELFLESANPDMLVFVDVVTSSSGIRFSVGETIDDLKHYARPAGAGFHITVNNTNRTLRAKGAINDKFVVAW